MPMPGETYGVAILTKKLEGVRFPIAKQELMNKYGNEQFQWTQGGESFKLRDYLQRLPERIESITQITQTVGDSVKQSSR